MFAFLLAIPYTRAVTLDTVRQNWGNIASVWGLSVSIGVLFLAKSAYAAAQEAKSAARLRAALEELQDAAQKCTQIGLFARGKKWDLVQLRAQEAMESCRATVARWGADSTLKDSRNKVLQVATYMRAIVEETNKNVVDADAVLKAQLDSVEKLTAVVGRIQADSDSRSS